jgi:hypothetical protein
LNYVAGLGFPESDAKHLIQLIEDLRYPQAIVKIEENT